MPMNKDELFDIFREYATNEFADIPSSDNEVYYDFSEEFENKMLQLFKNLHSDKKSVKSNSIGRRKIIAILIAAIFILSVGAMSVSAIREPLVEFMYKIYDGFTDVFFDGDTSNKITYRYSFSEIPEGFVETEHLITDSVDYIKYENKQNKNIIEFSQNITDNISVSIDNEHGSVEQIQVDRNDINIYISDYGDYYYAFWNVDYYYMELTYHGTTTIEEIQKLISLIQ